jgi:hypothetical protein
MSIAWLDRAPNAGVQAISGVSRESLAGSNLFHGFHNILVPQVCKIYSLAMDLSSGAPLAYLKLERPRPDRY